MRSFYIRYAVLFSKAGLSIPAMLCSRAANAGNLATDEDYALAVMDYLKNSSHPCASWTLNNFSYHLAGLHERLQGKVI